MNQSEFSSSSLYDKIVYLEQELSSTRHVVHTMQQEVTSLTTFKQQADGIIAEKQREINNCQALLNALQTANRIATHHAQDLDQQLRSSRGRNTLPTTSPHTPARTDISTHHLSPHHPVFRSGAHDLTADSPLRSSRTHAHTALPSHPYRPPSAPLRTLSPPPRSSGLPSSPYAPTAHTTSESRMNVLTPTPGVEGVPETEGSKGAMRMPHHPVRC